MYKRPNPQPRRGCYTLAPPISPTATGRVADIVRKIHYPEPVRTVQRQWAPPVNFEFIAHHMTPEEGRVYIERCQAWHEQNPPAPPKPVQIQGPINQEPILAVIAKHAPSRPPVNAFVKAMREAGHTEARIQKTIDFYRRLEETYEERTAALELIFAKWPAASKPTPKPKPKVIKAVKKKMT